MLLNSSLISAADRLQQPPLVQRSPVATKLPQVTPLRWRKSPGDPAKGTKSGPSLIAPRSVNQQILPVAADKNIVDQDPFEDPFGDLEQTTDRPLEIIQPAPNAEPQPNVPPQPISQPEKTLPPPIRLPSAAPETNSFPLAEILPQEAVVAPPQELPANANLDCEQLDCARMRKQLEQTSIRDISLNMSPRFQPNTQGARPKSTAPRTWTDTKGRELVTGALVDYQFNRIVIRTTEGQTTQIATDRLSEKDLCYLSVIWGIPTECTLNTDLEYNRNWVPLTMTWKASALCHKPLYFEQIQLERYGHTAGPWTQPFLSGGHFILNIAALPYKMGMNPMNECQYSLGYYRPGSCAPWLISPVPLSLRGAAAEAGVIFGGGALFP